MIRRLRTPVEDSQEIDGVYVITKKKMPDNKNDGFDTPKFKKGKVAMEDSIDLENFSCEREEFEIRIESSEVQEKKMGGRREITGNVNNFNSNMNAKSNLGKTNIQNTPEELKGGKKNKTDVKKPNKKRKMIVDDESDEDYVVNSEAQEDEEYTIETTENNLQDEEEYGSDFKSRGNKSRSSVSNSTSKKPAEDSSESNLKGLAFSNPYNGLPEFLKSEKIQDKMRRRPDDANYDPTTLYVPESFLKSKDCTPVMKQYWKFKVDNFDKIILFKLGKFYELFYDDAIVGNQVLDLNWMGNDPKKLHVGFPEKCLEEKAARLVDAGFKVCVIEQTERPEEMMERRKSGNGGSKDKVVNRELCNVFTKGTYYSGSNKIDGLNYSNKYCVTLVCNLQGNASHHVSQKILSQQISNSSQKATSYCQWGFVIFDVTTLKFFIGQFNEDEDNYNKIMTLLYNIRPEEVIVARNNIPSYILNFIQTLSTKPQITYLKNEYNLLILNRVCQKYFGEDLEKWNQTVLKYVTDEENYKNACCALFNTITFLEKILLAEQCLSLGNFEEYQSIQDMDSFNNRSMIIDYQAVTNLELVETKIDPKNIESGSLLEYMNRCVTGFGKRMIKSWVLNPLGNETAINERLDMVEDLIRNPDLLSSFRTALTKWPDIERQCSKIYKFAITNNSKAVYFEDVSKNRLQEFFNLINFLIKSIEIFKLFEPYLDSFKSKRLIQKVTVRRQNEGGVPDVASELEHFSTNFTIKSELDENRNSVLIVEPTEGAYREYDDLKNEIPKVEEELDEILKKERKRLKCPVITYTHTKNYKYELEVPEEFVEGNKRPFNYKLTTSRKGYLRFHTSEITDLVEKLETICDKLKDETRKFNHILFKEFYLKSPIINDYIKNMAELDCIACLAIVSTQADGPMVRPRIIPLSENKGLPWLKLKRSRHPCLSSRCRNFVPNDVSIGENSKTAVVITGPNMGGKSTLLRQTCICVIMAQMGCYVPAEVCELTVADRIFTRIGARDK